MATTVVSSFHSVKVHLGVYTYIYTYAAYALVYTLHVRFLCYRHLL